MLVVGGLDFPVFSLLVRTHPQLDLVASHSTEQNTLCRTHSHKGIFCTALSVTCTRTEYFSSGDFFLSSFLYVVVVVVVRLVGRALSTLKEEDAE